MKAKRLLSRRPDICSQVCWDSGHHYTPRPLAPTHSLGYTGKKRRTGWWKIRDFNDGEVEFYVLRGPYSDVVGYQRFRRLCCLHLWVCEAMLCCNRIPIFEGYAACVFRVVMPCCVTNVSADHPASIFRVVTPCCVVLCCGRIPTFRTAMLPPSSELWHCVVL
jgi:hypothetical protein